MYTVELAPEAKVVRTGQWPTENKVENKYNLNLK